MLADEPKEDNAPRDVIEFVCQWCDETIKMDIALAGKQAPCPNPECRRIVKVPMPADPGKVAWRNAAAKPAGAKVDVEAPEGAWAPNRSIVSKESLEEAGALPDRQPPVGPRVWIARGMVATAVLLLLVIGTIKAIDWFAGKQQAKALAKAMAAVSGKEPSLRGPEAAIIRLAAGKYHLRRDEPRSALPDKGEEGSVKQLELARGGLMGQNQGSAEADALLSEVALAQLELIGSGKAVEERRRLPAKDVLREVVRTLQAIRQPDGGKVPEGRSEALRLVARRLAQSEAGLVDDLARQIGDGPFSLAVAGLELVRAGQNDLAKKLLDQVLPLYRREPPPKDTPAGAEPPKQAPPPPLTPEVVALAVALDRQKDLPKIEGAQKDIEQMGKAIATALRSPAEARQEAGKLRTPALKIEGLVAVADMSKEDSEAKSAIDAAADLVTGALGEQVISPWVLVRLVRVGAPCGAGEEKLLAVAGRIRDPALRGWAQLQVFRARLKGAGKVEDAAADLVEKTSLSHRLARVELARHNTLKDKDNAKAVDEWPDALKPYGHAGVALGLQGEK
jgi:hypothetical protein